MLGANYLSSMQNQSLQTSKGNASHTSGNNDAFDKMASLIISSMAAL